METNVAINEKTSPARADCKMSEIERLNEIAKLVFQTDIIVVDEFDLMSGNYDGCIEPIDKALACDVNEFENFSDHFNNF